MSSPEKLRAAILIISDTASKDASTDRTASALQSVFTSSGNDQWVIAETKIIPDDVLVIQRSVMDWTDNSESGVNLVVTSGGTGFAVKDLTPEAIGPLIHRHASGLVHTMLSTSLAVTPFAAMARPVAGTRNQTLILTLPGSPKGARENLEAVIKLLPHACTQAAGADSRTLHAGGVKRLEKEANISRATSAIESRPQSHTHDHHHHDHSHGHRHSHAGHAIPRAHTRPEDRPPQSNDPLAGPSRRYRKSPFPMLSVDEALKLVAEHTPAPTVIRRTVNEDLVGYVLAADVEAPEAVPAFRASIVDGYAIRIPSSGTFEKGTYPVSMVSHAQAVDLGELSEGHIARITTGAPLPPGADAVVMVEDTVLKSMTDDGIEEKTVEILTSEVRKGENVREIGSDVQAKSIILRKGEGITSAGGELGLLASVGVSTVEVYKKPVVAILSTGDEIVPHNHAGPLRLGEVRDTNRPTLITAVRGTGFEALDMGIASDKAGALESLMRDALSRADVLITSGGVSMGELDLLKPTIERALGGTIHFGRVSMKPGKPTTFASVPVKDESGARRTKLIFSLPGNPASAVVTYHLFVLPSLHQLAGQRPAGLPKVKVTVDEDVVCDAVRAEYARAVAVVAQDGTIHATTTGGQRSSRIGSFKGANALLCLPVQKEVLKKGSRVDALLMGRLQAEV
ncbi:uncharacterized protein PV09_07958 [Verruconis gallopava]|uniref:MoaB/Mog domain-containing protein n=1 Tax=Verruconis gallopava TaxID=253628 RepID=A0A0D2A186_9PEZI|nr:uncharacterized protein PV09_07958 [Verruconis gallopava]KIW00428.1 hypothetical protein PV09_07958 [Verruconis gallopava]